MKNVFLLFCLLCLTIQLSAQTPSVKNDEEAIKKVIIDETTAWANRDTMAYFAAYANNDLTQSAYNNRNMSIGINLGFAELQKYVRDGIKANPNKVYQPNMERSNWVIKTSVSRMGVGQFYPKNQKCSGTNQYELRNTVDAQRRRQMAD